jgi:hypothetical protein
MRSMTANDSSENESDLDQEDPPEPPAATSIAPGEQGGDSGSEEEEIGPLAQV